MAHFTYRSQYINFAEHLQNAWNPNMYYLEAPNRWSVEDWKKYFTMSKAFGFTNFEFWISPTLFDRPALTGKSPLHENFKKEMNEIIRVGHEVGITLLGGMCANCVSPDWYFACPKDKDDKKLIFDLWNQWVEAFPELDSFYIGSGDPGGCNRNGCNHETFVDLAIEITNEVLLKHNPNMKPFLGTWGTPFSGWGEDLKYIEGWDGTWAMLTDPKFATPETPAHIWNGKRERAKKAFEYLISNLSQFPKGTTVVINTGMDPDTNFTMGGSAKKYAREIAKTNPITTWDYSLAEGELIAYPHYRLPRMSTKMREWAAAAPYKGGMNYTMTPKLSLMTQYVAGQIMQDTDINPDIAAADFFEKVFGPEMRGLGELMEAFEVVHGWGYHPRNLWSKEMLRETYQEIIDMLEAADPTKCTLPIFPDAETYRQDLLWFAREFLKMAQDNCDRAQVRKEFWEKSQKIYDYIPMSCDPRAHLAADNFSKILEKEVSWADPIG